jgi:type I restriction enzyme S subunit
MARKLPRGWTYRELGELVRIESGGTPSRSNPDFWGGSMPWITAKDLKTFDLKDSQDRLTEVGTQRASVAPGNTILMLVRGMGLFKDIPIGVTTRPMAFNQDVKALHPKEEVSARFLGYALQAQRHYLMGNVDLAGHGTGRLSTHVVEELPLPLPKLDEQRRIVSVLDAADRQASLEEALLAARGAHYQSLLYTVFKPIEQKRAKGWRRVHLGEIFVERDERSGDLPLLAISGEQGIVPRDDLERRDTSAEDKSNYKVIRKSDIGYNTMRMWQGVFGLSQYDGIISPAYTVVTPDRPRILGEFAAHLFSHPRVVHAFHRYSQGLVDDTLLLKYPHFSEIRLPIPDISEQRRIARLLDAQLREIGHLRELVELRRRQRRGLMQKLTTGQWRLTSDLAGMERADV